jgi:hypothetical protein
MTAPTEEAVVSRVAVSHRAWGDVRITYLVQDLRWWREHKK